METLKTICAFYKVEEALQEKWKKNTIRNLIESMPRRIEKHVLNQGYGQLNIRNQIQFLLIDRILIIAITILVTTINAIEPRWIKNPYERPCGRKE